MRTSAKASVSDIAQRPERFLSRCVTVIAYSDGRSLFAKRTALTKHVALRNISLSGSRLGNQMMGVYGLPTLSTELMHRQSSRGLRWRLTGLVETCADMDRRARQAAKTRRQDGMISIVMLTGHCHYLGGPVLQVTAAKVVNENK